MAILTKNALSASNQASFPNNTTGAITPLILRNFNQDVIDTLVDSLNTGSYAVTTGSNDFTQPNNFTSISASSFVSASEFVGDGSKLTNITASIALPILDEGVLQGYATSMNFTGSAISATIVGGTAVVQVNIDNVGLVTTASFNAYTQSTNQFTASTNTSITNLNASSASQQISINNLNTTTASLLVETQNLELFSSSTLTRLTNIESTTASLNSSVTQLNASSASQQISIDNLNQFTASQSTASLVTSITNLNTFSASALVSISNLNSTTASLNTSVTNINSATASLFTSASLALVTASFDTGTRNLTFTKGNTQTFSVNIPDTSGSTIPAGTISSSAQITSLGFVSSSITGGVFVSASQVFSNQIQLYYGDGSSVAVQINNVENAISASYAVTASHALNVQTINTGSFATTGSNTFYGDQIISGNVLPLVNGQGDLGSDTFKWNSVTVNGQLKGSSINTTGRGLVGTLRLSDESFPLSFLADREMVGDGNGANTHMYYATSSSDVNGLREFAYVPSGSPTTPDMNILSASFASTIAGITTTAGYTTTASFNAYTQSNDSKVNSLINATASYATSAITASSLITASAVGNTITFTKGDASTFNVSVTSTPIDTGSFATTGSNSFNGNQIINGVLSISSSATYDLDITGGFQATAASRVSGSNGIANITQTFISVTSGSGAGVASFTGARGYMQVSGDGNIISLYSRPSTIGGFTDGAAGGGFAVRNTTVNYYPIQFQSTASFTDGRVTFTTPLSASAGFTASLQNGYAWVGNSLGENTQVATSSFGTAIDTGSYATTGSNSFIGNQTITGNLLVSGSNTIDVNVIGRVSITGPTSGQPPRLFISSSDGAFTELARNFNQISTTDVNGGLDAYGQIYASTSSVAGQYIGVYDNPGFNTDVEVAILVSNSGSTFNDWDNAIAFGYVPFMSVAPNLGNNPAPVMTRGLQVTGSTQVQNFTASLQQGYVYVGNASGITTTVATSSFVSTINTGSFATLGANRFTGSQTISSSLNVSGSANFVGGDVNFTDQGRNINIDVDRTIIKGQKPTLISSSLDIQGSLTASLANGYAWVGDATNHNVLVATSSFATNVSNLATTGSNSFNGNQTITGSLILSSSAAVELTVIGNMVVTGSAFGNVVSMSITANTASMDLSRGNYFTLTLADTATTHISASNVQPGVSATLVITTGTNSSASLAPTMLQPSGSAYSATNGSAKKDVLSIVAVASNVPFVVSTKNMI